MDNNDNYIGRMLDNRYEILEKIGTGGMAVVYKARCHRLNRFVAVKILRGELAKDSDFRRRFHAESQAVAMLSDPNIVSVYDVNTSGELDYIVMELIEGITLKQYINRKGVLNWKETLHFGTQIAKALKHAHSRGIIHRDIKPHNIMILKDGSVKVADFGIARLLTTQNTLTNEALGSVHYISPEQAKGGHVDERSDLYSLGVVMYEMLTNRLPFEGESAVAVAIQHINSIPLTPREINPEIPVGLEQITMHAMEPSLDIRYSSTAQMLYDLEEFRKNPSMVFDYSTLSPIIAPVINDSTRIIPTDAVNSAVSVTPRRQVVERTSTRTATKDERGKNRRTARKTTVLIGAFCIIVFLALLFVFMWNYFFKDVFNPKEEDKISVPNFVGMYIDSVKDNPEYTQYFTFKITEIYSQNDPVGRITAQTPTADRQVNPSDGLIEIELEVSNGEQEMYMPDVFNIDYRDAQIELERLKLGLVIDVTGEYSEDITQSRVIYTVPAADEIIVPGGTVYIVYSLGPEVIEVEVPDVLDKPESQAKTRLQALDLSVNIEYEFSDEVAVGRVMFQSHEAGEMVPLHTEITIQISKGPEPSPSPSVEPSNSPPPSPPVTSSSPDDPIEPNNPDYGPDEPAF